MANVRLTVTRVSMVDRKPVLQYAGEVIAVSAGEAARLVDKGQAEHVQKPAGSSKRGK